MSDKLHTVFIFGAGASADIGIPTAENFVEKIHTIHRQFRKIIDAKSFDSFFECYELMSGVFEKSYINRENIEALFSFLDMAGTVGRLGDITDLDKIIGYKKALTRVIDQTIRLSTPITQRDGNSVYTMVNPNNLPSQYEILLDKIKKMDSSHTFSFITFNYDLGLDWALAKYLQGLDKPFQYYLDINPHKNNNLEIVKLHGSLNWRTDSTRESEYLSSTRDKDFSQYNSPIHSTYISTKHGQLYFDEKSKKHYLFETARYATGVHDTFIVPPTWNKGTYYELIRRVWQEAARKIQSADNIIAVGYSIPETDSYFRELFALGTFHTKRLNKLLIVNPDTHIEKRYDAFIGRGISKGINKQYEFIAKNFDGKNILDKI